MKDSSLILVEELSEALAYDAPQAPERRLVAAVIQRAILDLEEAREAASALDWFDDDASEPYSFLWCAGVLEIDAEKLRGVCETESGRDWLVSTLKRLR